MQQSWQNMGMSAAQGGAGVNLASLQTPNALTLAANQTSAQSGVPGINQIQMPSWLSKSADANLGELTSSYAGVGAAFDPSGQVAARNNAIGYNTSAGTQAANNAATEYSNRAAQSGASQLGAGVVKAQAMMPVLQQNAALKTDAADVAAKAHQEAATLASQIAGTIGQLRMSYLGQLTQYAQGQQGLALDQYKAQQAVAGQAAQTQLGYAQLQAQTYSQALAAKQQQSDQARLAAMGLLSAPKPVGMYTTNNQGQVTSGMDTYNAIKNYGSNQAAATQALRGMF